MKIDEAILKIKKEWIVKETDKAFGFVITERDFMVFQEKKHSHYLYWIPKSQVRGWDTSGLIFVRRFSQKLDREVEELVQYE